METALRLWEQGVASSNLAPPTYINTTGSEAYKFNTCELAARFYVPSTVCLPLETISTQVANLL